MRITSRRKTIAFFLTFGVCLAALAFAVGSGWIIVNWREGVKVFLGVIFFGAIITGITLNTIFLVHEIRRNEQHDSFINAVTHELKTPITSIRLYLETLQQRQVDDGQRREFYKLMLLDTDRLLDTVEQVLRAGKAGDKRAARHRMEVEFGALVRECIDLTRTRHHLQPDAVRYEETVNGIGTRVLGDPEELRTAVFNVLDNAIKYSGKDVDVAVQLRAPDEEHLLLRVRDRGVGIAPDELKQIFKRFYRVPSRALARVKGTGLGLFIVRAIARKHGGRVFAESEGVGCGTTVSIELPRSAA
jgi:two-component system, OmpR family, sensor histidine kinase SenX3